MMKFNNNTKVNALATIPVKRSDIAVLAFNDEPVLNPVEEGVFPAGRKHSDLRLKKGLSRPSKMYEFATLNCRSLKSVSSQAELNKLMHVYNIPIVCIQEHCYVHNDTEPDIVARSVGTSTIFTASTVQNEQKGLCPWCCHHYQLETTPTS